VLARCLPCFIGCGRPATLRRCRVYCAGVP